MYQFSDLEIQTVARDILDYLRAKPQQKDTLKGLCEWWLMEERLDDTIDLVTEALGFLLSQKMLIEIRCGHVNAVYQINPAMSRARPDSNLHGIIKHRPHA